MAEGAIFLNRGPLFKNEQLERIEELPEWNEYDAAARAAFDRIRETYEKHATLLAGAPSADETRFFVIGPVLHALNFTHSAMESFALNDEQNARVDYVGFGSGADFLEAQETRGSVAFFRTAIAVIKTVAWGASLDEAPEPPEPEEGEEPAKTMPPPQELHLLLQATGKDYGILCSGCDWRLYHRGTSGTLETFFQADMIAAMKSNYEDFKIFFLLFNRAAFVKDNSGLCFLDRMLQ